jgi:hypothetical protein
VTDTEGLCNNTILVEHIKQEEKVYKMIF